MNRALLAKVPEVLRADPPPLLVTPSARATLGERLWASLVAELDAVPLASREAPCASSPAVLVLTPADMQGERRSCLVATARACLPGRPVVVGGAQDRTWLLEAINVWRACGWVTEAAADDLVWEALVRARRACELQLSLQQASEALADDCLRLDAVVAELGETRARLLHAERLTTIGQITDTLAVRLALVFDALAEFEGHVERPCPDQDFEEVLDCALEGIRGLGALIDDMVTLPQDRTRTADLRDVSVDDLVERSVRLFRTDPGACDRRIVLVSRSQATVQADRARLQLVLLNLLRNAMEATEPGDVIEIRTRREGGTAVVEVEDHGCGMDAADLARCFAPFRTSKGSRGLGLGLGVSRAAVQRQGGQLLARSSVGLGSVFTIVLPLAHHAHRGGNGGHSLGGRRDEERR